MKYSSKISILTFDMINMKISLRTCIAYLLMIVAYHGVSPSHIQNQMPFTVLSGTTVESSSFSKTLICDSLGDNIEACAQECYDLQTNGTGCPGFYTGTTQTGTCHICRVSTRAEINTNSYTTFTNDHLVYLILEENGMAKPDVAMGFEKFIPESSFMNGTNTEGTTTSIVESDLIEGVNGRGIHLHNSAKIHLTGSGTKCWTNLYNCSSGMTMSIWMKPTAVGDSYVVATGVLQQRGIAFLYKLDNKVRTLVTLETGRFEALSTSTLQVNSEWYLVTGTYEASLGASIYINGVMEKENRFENPRSETVDQEDWSAHIGVRDRAPYEGGYFNGYVDEFKYYYRLLNRAGELILSVEKDNKIFKGLMQIFIYRICHVWYGHFPTAINGPNWT